MNDIPCIEHIPVKDVRRSITIQMGRHNQKGSINDSIALYEWGDCDCGKKSTRLVAIMNMPFASVMAPVDADSIQGDTYALLRVFTEGFLKAITSKGIRVSLYSRLREKLDTSQDH